MQNENALNPRFVPLQEKGVFTKSQITKSNSTHLLQNFAQPQKKPSMYNKLQNQKLNKENKISESLAFNVDRENQKGSFQNKSGFAQHAKPPTLRVINPNVMNAQYGNTSNGWNSNADSYTSAKSFFPLPENFAQEESFEIGTPELTRECSSPFFSDNTPTLSSKSANDSFGVVSKRVNSEAQGGFDARRLKRDCQLSPRTKGFFDDVEKKRKEVNGKSSITEILTFYLGMLPEVQSKYHWKLFLDLAEACKKECSYKYAKFFYKAAISLQPYNPDVMYFLAYVIKIIRFGLSMQN